MVKYLQCGALGAAAEVSKPILRLEILYAQSPACMESRRNYGGWSSSRAIGGPAFWEAIEKKHTHFFVASDNERCVESQRTTLFTSIHGIIREGQKRLIEEMVDTLIVRGYHSPNQTIERPVSPNEARTGTPAR